MRRYTALFQTIGSFELYTADGRYVYDFSYLSSATSYDRADAEARRAVIKRIRTQTKASGYHILPGVVTTARTERTNEDRLCTAVRERFPVLSPALEV